MIKMLRPFVLFCLLVFGSPAWAAADRAEYKLTFKTDSPKQFHVAADLPVVGNELLMAQSSMAIPLPNGFADFVENLGARDTAGKRVLLTQIGKGRWKLGRSLKRVRIEYDVALKHDDVKWGISGLFARGYALDSAIFFMGQAAFITGTPEFKRPALVRFVVPKGWQTATALPAFKGNAGTYEAKDWNTLLGSGSMVGRLASRTIKSGPLEVVLTAPKPLESSIELMAEALDPIIAGYVQDLGGAPDGKYGVFFSAAPFLSGGETTSNTISMLFPKAPDKASKGIWFVIAHEVFHLWNAVAIKAGEDESDSVWFMEGFTVYGQMLGTYRSGLNTEEQLLKELAQGYDSYVAGYKKAAGKASLRSAGPDKATYFDLLYYGGMTAALALDIEGRSLSPDGARGFTEMMRLAFSEYGKTGKRYAYDDLIRLATKANGIDMRPFFDRFVNGTELIPLADYLKKAGLELSTVSGKSVITRDPHTTVAQRSIFPPTVRAATGSK